MKAKTMRRSLFMSVMSLLLCMSMLVGTTFAWFTDSVTSANNIIKSGNLDVELYYQVEGQTDWTKVTGTTNVFKENALWEPGHTEVVKLKVVNEGSLALKYQLGVNVASETGSVNALGKEFKLSDHIKFAVIDGDKDYSRDEAVAAAEKASATPLKSAYSSQVTSLLPRTETNTDNEDIVTMVVYMPTSVGNEANHAKDAAQPTINLGINLLAAQQMAENDSFGPEYDKGAAWDGTIPATTPDSLVVDADAKLISINDADAFAYLNTLLNDGNFVANYGNKWEYTVELNCDVNLLGKEWTPINLSNVVAFDGKGHTISNLMITSGKDSVGLFGALATNDLGYGTIKNLTIDGAYVKGGNNSGVLVGSSTGTIENVTVLNATIEANKYIGVLAGRTCHVKNCAVKNSTVVASDKTVGGLVGYCVNDPGTASATGNTVENVTVTGAWNVGGMFGQAQNANVDGNTVKKVTVTSTTALPADADANEVRTAEVAARSAFAGTTIGTNTVENVICGIEVYGLTLISNGENSKIIVNDKEGFLNLTKLFADWTALFTDGNGNEWSNYANGAGADYYYGGRWTVSLEADIDLNNATIAPITINHPVSAGDPTFDGNNHTIKNAKIVADAAAENMTGLFNVSHEAFKNLKLDNIHVTGSNVGNSNAGILAGYCSGRIDNITITNSSVTGGKYTGGVVGSGYTDISNCKLTNVTVKGGYKLGGIIGYICAETGYTHNVTGNTLTDCTVDGIGGGVFAGGKTEYIIGKIVGNYNCNGTCNNNTITNMTTSATANIGKIESNKTVNQ